MRFHLGKEVNGQTPMLRNRWWQFWLWFHKNPEVGFHFARFVAVPTQEGLSGWHVIDARNAPGQLSDAAYDPVCYDPATGKTFELTKETK